MSIYFITTHLQNINILFTEQNSLEENVQIHRKQNNEQRMRPGVASTLVFTQSHKDELCNNWVKKKRKRIYIFPEAETIEKKILTEVY